LHETVDAGGLRAGHEAAGDEGEKRHHNDEYEEFQAFYEAVWLAAVLVAFRISRIHARLSIIWFSIRTETAPEIGLIAGPGLLQ
jgi:hypothetical protein